MISSNQLNESVPVCSDYVKPGKNIGLVFSMYMQRGQFTISERISNITGGRRLIILGFFLLLVFGPASAQVIHGRVVEDGTLKPIPYATIYIEGTFIATYSDTGGNFTLDISGGRSMPLTVSALGFFSTKLSINDSDQALEVKLKPKSFILKEIVVTGSENKKARKRNIRLFKSVFLGETYNASKCTIVNEDDILFMTSSNGDTLKAFTDKPIIIKNSALGYTVTYFLDYFKYNIPEMLFDMKGNILFTEDIDVKEGEKIALEKKRRAAYLGSRMHFFRALYDNKLAEEGFEIRDSLIVLDYEAATGIPDSLNNGSRPKFVLPGKTVPDRHYVTYKSRMLGSVMVILGKYFMFNSNGFYEGSSVIWEGEMAKQRIGDWLPYEYKPGDSR
ncbi:MAG: carboxypeptidase-like regulatory domain-containing protein [Bacteroidales bacterium]